MIVSSPRIFGTPRRPGDRLVSVWLAATVALTFAANADAQSANAVRAARTRLAGPGAAAPDQRRLQADDGDLHGVAGEG